MKLLYFGPLNWGGTCLQRCEALRKFVNVYAVDSRIFLPEVGGGKNLWHWLQLRIGVGPLVSAIGHSLIREVRRFRPDWLWIDQGLMVSRYALASIREEGGSHTVHYTPDSISAPGFNNLCFPAAMPFYDLCITTKPNEIDQYRQFGAQRTILSYQGYDSAIHRPVVLSEKDKEWFETDVVFVGQRMKARACSLETLIRHTNIRVALYGRHWERGKTGRILGPLQRGWVYGDEYAKALCGAKIALCFLAKEVGDLYTTRTFEIPACGVFMLAERTELHRELFIEDEEAVYFSNDEELIDKTRFYLSHGNARLRIARAGHCKVKHYTWEARMKECLDLLNEY